jgi:hypothetical protein
MIRHALLFLLPICAWPACVATAAYNGQRTGATLTETVLTTSNVSSLIKLGSWAVDDQIFGQPLVCNGFVYVATAGGTIYKFSASSPGSAAIWSVSAGTPSSIFDHTGFAGHQGCTASPAIDEGLSVIYATCLDNSAGWRLYALNLSDGSHVSGSPVTLNGLQHQGRTFASASIQTRTAHLITGGYVYVGWNGYDDFSGWVTRCNQATLACTAYSTGTTSGGSAGVWMGNGGPSVDGNGKVYVTTANGDWNGTTQLGQSLIRFSGLTVDDFFTPSNFATINASDSDFGSGPAVIFGDHVLVATKDGLFWRFSTASLGGLQGSGGAEEQTFDFGDSFQFNRIAVANNNMYAGGNPDRYAWNGTTFATSPTASGSGGCKINSYSSNADGSGTKILWCLSNSGTQSLSAGRLVAFNADSMATLWSSNTVGGDALGNWGKWAQPVVEGGRVYVATFSNTVVVYGLPTTGSAMGGKITLGGKVVLR